MKKQQKFQNRLFLLSFMAALCSNIHTHNIYILFNVFYPFNSNCDKIIIQFKHLFSFNSIVSQQYFVYFDVEIYIQIIFKIIHPIQWATIFIQFSFFTFLIFNSIQPNMVQFNHLILNAIFSIQSCDFSLSWFKIFIQFCTSSVQSSSIHKITFSSVISLLMDKSAKRGG